MIAQLKKGVLEFCILSIISKKELYGYEIMKGITGVFADTNESTVYAILRRLLSDGSTECYSKEESNGPPRKYYRVTAEGKKYLQKALEDWNFITEAVNKII